MGAVGKWNVVVGGQRVKRQAMPMQFELSDHLGGHQREDIREGRDDVSGPWLLADGRASKHPAALQDDGLQPGPAEIGGRCQAVVPATHDDRVVFSRHPPEYRRGRFGHAVIFGERPQRPSRSLTNQ